MKRILIGLAAATAVFFAASWIVVATVGNKDHGWRGVIGGITWFGFLLFAAAFVVAVLVALIKSKVLRSAATLAVLALTIAGVAQAAPRAGTVHFTLYSANIANRDVPELVQMSGALSGVGHAVANDDARTSYVPVTFTFGGGTITLHVIDPFRWNPNTTTCTATTHNLGTWTITAGTGAYKGVAGHGTFTEDGGGIGVRNAKGACQQKFALNYVVARASGSVTRS